MKYLMLLSLFPRELRRKIWKVIHLNPTTYASRVVGGRLEVNFAVICHSRYWKQVYDDLIFIPKGFRNKYMEINYEHI